MHARNIQSLRQVLWVAACAHQNAFYRERVKPHFSGEPVHRTAIADGLGNLAGRSVLLGTNDGLPDLCESLVWERRNPVTGGVVTGDAVLESEGPAKSRPSQLESEIIASSRDLSTHQVPAPIRFVPALETSPSGKFARCETLS